MNEQYITEDIYYLLKEKRFPFESVFMGYGNKDVFPSLANAEKWLREKHGLHIIVNWDYSHSMEKSQYSVRVRWIENKTGFVNVKEWCELQIDNYEEAVKIGLKKALELL